MSKVSIEESTLTSIGDAIREKAGSSELIPPTEMAQRITAIESGSGMTAVENASVIQLWSLNDLGAAKSELHLKNTNTLFYFCHISNAKQTERQNVTVEELTVTCDQKITQAQSFLENPRVMPDAYLRKLTLYADLSGVTQLPWFIVNCSALEEIGGTPINLSSATKAASFFYRLPALREVRFQGTISFTFDVSGAPSLSAESIRSVISCLSDSSQGLTLTLSKAAVDKAYESLEGAADGSTSAAWKAIVDSKTNWTISLV